MLLLGEKIYPLGVQDVVRASTKTGINILSMDGMTYKRKGSRGLIMVDDHGRSSSPDQGQLYALSFGRRGRGKIWFS